MKRKNFSNLKWITFHDKWVCSKLTLKEFYENNKELFSLDGKIPSYHTARRYLIETGKKLEQYEQQYKQTKFEELNALAKDAQVASNPLSTTTLATSVSFSIDNQVNPPIECKASSLVTPKSISCDLKTKFVSDDNSLDSPYITNYHDPLYLASRKGLLGTIAYTPRVVNKQESHFSLWDNISFSAKLARHRRSKFVNVILEPVKPNIEKAKI